MTIGPPAPAVSTAADPERPGLPTSDPVLTDRVLASFGESPSPRFREIMRSLVSHAHAFVTDVRLTEQEWMTAVHFLTRVGQISDDKRQETILLSDVLGLSMLVIGVNHPSTAPVTESTVFGPFFSGISPAFRNGDDISGGAAGEPCEYSGTVTDTDGRPIAGALLEIWHADEYGNYDAQYPDLDTPQGRGHLNTDSHGRFNFRSILPEPYPIPEDGPVGDLLHAARRSPMRPAHVHFMIKADGFATLTTHVFRAGDPYLGADAVFGEKDSLVKEYARRVPSDLSAGQDTEQDPYGMAFDFVLDRDPAQ